MILEIALGIVLGMIILTFLPFILIVVYWVISIGLIIIGGVLVIDGVIIGLIPVGIGALMLSAIKL